MRVLHVVCLVTVLSLCSSMASALPHSIEQHYFPLHEGDVWTFATVDADAPDILDVVGRWSEIREITVLASSEYEGVRTFVVDGYCFSDERPSTEFFNDDRGRTCEHFGSSAEVWYPWSEVGGWVMIPKTGGHDCYSGAVGRIEGGCTAHEFFTITVPAGTFHNCLKVVYDPAMSRCADAGPVYEIFAPEIGLIERQVLTIAGFRTWQLVDARINGVSIGMALDQGNAAGSPALPWTESTWGKIKAAFD